MWKQGLKLMPMRFSGNPFLTLPVQNVYQQIRTTYILKRRWPPGLYKKSATTKVLRSRNFVYDLVENTVTRKKGNLEVILTDYVANIGNRGDRITMKEKQAYNQLLLPGLAVYASPENIEKFSKLDIYKGKPKYSSPYVERTMSVLSNTNITILMNKDVSWTVEPWHVRMSLRKAGIHVPEDAILLPEEPISGPNMELENKFFEVTVTINGEEKVYVKCFIHHWTTNVSDKLSSILKLEEQSHVPIFAEKNAGNYF